MAIEILNDEYFMKMALQEARLALAKNEVPVGAVIVHDKKIIARAHNLTETLNDVTAHAEMQAFTAAADFIGGKYLHDCTLYVTLEPCFMCAGASAWAQISEIKFGAHDQKKGFKKISKEILHPKTKVAGGLLEKECSNLISSFFSKKRNQTS
ncbi:MAG: tRNA-specific adenosine deaminase [Lentimicrobiaceae bacterium]|jgi:tRNA(adenine34) deaminase|nr:tRNA-specific adenosine deaminase [Lentimicrobiaceae bacterium]MDG1901675.1 nucleoside deaminase [Bacteroidales bacterium]